MSEHLKNGHASSDPGVVRRAAPLVILVLVSLVLAACTTEETQEDDTADTDPGETDAEEEPADDDGESGSDDDGIPRSPARSTSPRPRVSPAVTRT